MRLRQLCCSFVLTVVIWRLGLSILLSTYVERFDWSEQQTEKSWPLNEELGGRKGARLGETFR